MAAILWAIATVYLLAFYLFFSSCIIFSWSFRKTAHISVQLFLIRTRSRSINFWALDYLLLGVWQGSPGRILYSNCSKIYLLYLLISPKWIKPNIFISSALLLNLLIPSMNESKEEDVQSCKRISINGSNNQNKCTFWVEYNRIISKKYIT